METLMSVCVGVGLSAACGFRVFVPLLAMSVAAHSGHLSLGHGFEWIGSNPALIAFSVATVVEIVGYYIPWVDHLLDTLASPAAVVAGTVVTASAVADMSPFLKWSLAVIAGGGVAGVVQSGTVLTRAASTVTTGGLGNPVVATLELFGAIITSFLAIIAPFVAAGIVLTLLFVVARKLWQRSHRKAIAPTLNPSVPLRTG